MDNETSSGFWVQLLLLPLTIIALPFVVAVFAEQVETGGPIAGVLFLYFLFLLWQLRFLGMLIVQIAICIGLRGGKDGV